MTVVEVRSMDIGESFREIGEFGYYQKLIIFSLSVTTNFLSAFQGVGMALLGIQPTFMCKDKSKEHSELFTRACGTVTATDNCVKCENCAPFYRFDDNFTSVVSEWDLVCEESYKVGLLQSVFMAGVLCGAFTFGRLSDTIGRLKCVYMSVGIMIILSFLGAFSTSYTMFAVIKFLTGFCNGGSGIVTFVYMCEIVGASFRAFTGTCQGIIFAVGIMILGLAGYFIREWRQLVMWTSAPFFASAALFWLLPESPRWLYSHGHIEEAESVINMIGEKNLGHKCTIRLKVIQSDIKPDSTVQSQNKSYSTLDLITHPFIRMQTLIQLYSWFANSVVYYGLTIGAGSLGGNKYLAVAMSGFVEIPGTLLTYKLLDRLGRKPVLCACMIFGGVSCLCILALPTEYYGTKVTLALLGKMGISASFNVIYIHSTELLPTVVRNMGMGLNSMAARVGGILAPMIIPLDNLYPSLQFIVFGALGVFGGLLNMKLPETMGKDMPETIQDLDPKKQIFSRKEEKESLLSCEDEF